MRLPKAPALVGGAAGLVGAAAAVGIAQQRRTVGRARSHIDRQVAAKLGALPADREGVVHTDDGLDLHFEELGPADAPLTVVFVHGFTLNCGSFHFQRVALRERFGDDVRAVSFDLRSHGRSQHSPSEACTIEQLGRDLLSVLDQRVPSGPVVLVGHSMGGMTLMALADLRPDLFVGPGAQVRAVTLINTSSGELRTVTLGLPALFAKIRGPVIPFVLRGMTRNAALVERGRRLGKDLAWVITKRLSFADPNVGPAVVAYCTNMIAATPVDVVADFIPTLMAHDGRLGLRNLVDLPVLVLGADQDALTPVEHTRAIANALPRARLIIAPNSGHLLMLEHPDVVDNPLFELVDSVLSSVRSGARSA